MLKKLLFYIALISLVCIYGPRAYASAPDPSAVVGVQIWDNNIKDYSAFASGVLLDNNQVLTDYHVAERVINDPTRYQLVVCLSRKINTLPDCGYTASPDSLSENQLSQDLDLALLDLTGKGTPASKIKDIKDFTVSDFPNVKGINLASFGTDISSLKIKSGSEIQTLGYPVDTLTYSKGQVIGHEYYPSNNIVYVNIDAELNSGSSGGAAFDQDGNFVGITPGGWRDSKGKVVQSYFVPVTSINWWLNELRQQAPGSIKQATLPLPDHNTVLATENELCQLGDNDYCLSSQTLTAGVGSGSQQPLTISMPDQPTFVAPVNSGKTPGATSSRPSFLSRIFNWLFNRPTKIP